MGYPTYILIFANSTHWTYSHTCTTLNTKFFIYLSLIAVKCYCAHWTSTNTRATTNTNFLIDLHIALLNLFACLFYHKTIFFTNILAYSFYKYSQFKIIFTHILLLFERYKCLYPLINTHSEQENSEYFS